MAVDLNNAQGVTLTSAAPAAPQQSAVEQASAAALQRLATTGTALPDGAKKAPVRSPTGTGRFASDGKKEVGEQSATPRSVSRAQTDEDNEDGDDAVVTPQRPTPRDRRAPEDAVQDPDDDDTDDGPYEDEQDLDDDDADADDDVSATSDEEHDDELDDDDNGDVLTVPIPGRQPGTEFALEVDSQETAERVRQLVNGYMNSQVVRTAQEDLGQKYAQLEQFQEQISGDPAGFFLETIPHRPDVAEHVVMTLLTQPALWERVRERVATLADSAQFDMEAKMVKAERFEMREELRTYATEQRAVNTNLQQLQHAIAVVTSDDIDDAEKPSFERAAWHVLKAHADRYDLLTIPMDDVPTLLAPVMKRFGIHPVAAADRLAAKQDDESVSSRQAKHSRKQVVKSSKSHPQTPGKTGQEFVRGAERRRVAGRVAPAGAGSPNTTGLLEPPRRKDGSKMGIQDTIEWHKAQAKKGRHLMTPGVRT